MNAILYKKLLRFGVEEAMTIRLHGLHQHDHAHHGARLAAVCERDE